MMNLLRRYLLAILLLVVPSFSQAGYPPYVPMLQPYRITSPNGTYLFEVKPSNPDGTGPCMVALTIKDTKECVWKRKLPFTFWQACVADDGVVLGFGYNAGPLGNSIPESGICSNFIVRIFDEKGNSVYEEALAKPLRVGGLF